MYSFLTVQLPRTLSAGMEASGRLGPAITAFRKKHFTTDITIDQRCILEDALEMGAMLGIIKE